MYLIWPNKFLYRRIIGNGQVLHHAVGRSCKRRSKLVVLNHLLLTLRNERLVSVPYN